MIKNLFSSLLLISVMTSCKPDLYQTKWQSTPVIADGSPQEWKLPLRFYDAKSHLSYSVTNDLENLYICVRITEEAGQMKVMRAGMQVWIDTTGKNDQSIGILFPQRVQTAPADAPRQEGKERGTRDPGAPKGAGIATRNRFLQDYKEMQLTGFHAPIRGAVPLINDFGINLGINWDSSKYDNSNIMFYEAVIPFRTFFKNKLSPSDSTRKFGMSIVVNALPAPKSSGGGGSRGGGSTGGGGMSGGGMHGGGGGGRGGHGGSKGGTPAPANPLYQTDKIKMRMQLSVKQGPA
jgi:hypothetical protein